jgi:hypothetical protein
MKRDFESPFPMHPLVGSMVGLIEDLVDLAAAAARRQATTAKRRPAKTGRALRPGPNTPLWNVLVRQVAPLLRKRGSKVNLARVLGISKQRLHICFKSRTGALDAERTLFLLAWLAARRRGRPLA